MASDAVLRTGLSDAEHFLANKGVDSQLVSEQARLLSFDRAWITHQVNMEPESFADPGPETPALDVEDVQVNFN